MEKIIDLEKQLKAMTSPGRIEECLNHGAYMSRALSILGKKIYNTCPKCSDDNIKKIDDGKKRERIKIKIECAGIGKRFMCKSFDNYYTSTQEAKIMLNKCKRYADNFHKVQEKGSNVIMCGTHGTGKTHLATAIIKKVIEDGYNAKYVRLSDYIAEVRSTYSIDSKSACRQILAAYSSKDLLVIDEIDIPKFTESDDRLFFDLIDSRYMKMLPTILITNYTPGEFKQKVNKKIADRMSECSVVYAFDFESYRN